jgi:hypothetical protein
VITRSSSPPFFPFYMKKFVVKIQSDLEKGIKYTSKMQVEKIASGFGINNKNLIKELTELAIVKVAKRIVKQGSPVKETFLKIVDLYHQQVNLSQRTSESMRLQQYSTPAPISYLAGIYVQNGRAEETNTRFYFEPSAGNGLLTIALPANRVYANEIDDIRLENLHTQEFAKVTSKNAINDLAKELQYSKLFDGIITNPPFGVLDHAVDYNGYSIKPLDHLMCLRALDCMKETGRAAMIIGGHTSWDEQGRIQAGKNRIFFNYLYHHYNVDDVLQIDGHKLYSRQGTSFNVRLILINGRKKTPIGVSPLYNPNHDIVINDFENLFNRVMLSVDINKEKRIRIAKAKAIAKQKQLELLMI